MSAGPTCGTHSAPHRALPLPIARSVPSGPDRAQSVGGGGRGLNSGGEAVEEVDMHGAWAFDLLLVLLAAATGLLAFRQTQLERDQSN
ncbi:MAG TPA: hypothetical protein VNC61_11625 [Acidimicrobiales bacterium]|nr:hypothetical protein [Acidimicrobiales bacterium]